MMRPRRTALVSLLALSLALVGASLLTGCGSEGPTAPVTPVYTSDSPPPFVQSSTAGWGVGATAGDSDWQQVASKWIWWNGGVVSGSRYTLTFPEGAVSGKRIRIWERAPHVLDVVFGPHGTEFGQTVTLTINLAGTNVDPGSPNYDGSVPEFYYLNEESDVWEPLPSSRHGAILTVQLEHFSRYAVASKRPNMGTADW